MSSFAPSCASAIDTFLADSTAQPLHNLPRAVVLVGSTSTPSLYSGSSGYATLPADLSTAAPITEDSVFDLFSCTKLVTIIATLQLVEQGKVRVEDEARKWVPELAKVMVCTGFEGEEPMLEEAKREVTVEMLMNHTSGFTYEFSGDHADRQGKMRERLGFVSGVATKASITGMPAMYQPGERWHYSTSNDWLSLVVEAVSGQDLESYFQEHIFGPLGITDMSFIPNPARIDMAVDAVPPSTEYTTRPIDFTPKSQHFGGTGLQGSPKSYLRLLRLLLAGGTLDGQRILSSATVDTMFDTHLATPELRAEMGSLTRTVADPFSRREQKTYEGVSWGYGGMLSGEGIPSGRGKGAMTWAGYAHTFWVVDRAKDVAFVVWTNLVPFGSQKIFDLWEKAEPEIYKGIA